MVVASSVPYQDLPFKITHARVTTVLGQGGQFQSEVLLAFLGALAVFSIGKKKKSFATSPTFPG